MRNGGDAAPAADAIWSILVLRLGKLGQSVLTFFHGYSRLSFTELAHLPCSMPYFRGKPMSQFQEKYSLFSKEALFDESLGRGVFALYACRSLSYHVNCCRNYWCGCYRYRYSKALSRSLFLPLSLPSDWSSFLHPMESYYFKHDVLTSGALLW